MIILTVIGIIIFSALALGVFYLIGLFNPKVAGHVDLILFAVRNLNPRNEKLHKAPKRLLKLVRALFYRRKLFAAKLQARRLRKQSKKTAPH